MELLARDTALKDLERSGIGMDARYPGTGSLTFVAKQSANRFWAVPGPTAVLRDFVGELFRGIVPDSSCLVLQASAGPWFPPLEPGREAIMRAHHRLLTAAGLATDSVGAVRVARSEYDLVFLLILQSLIFGDHRGTDLYVVPDHGRQILWTDHHGVVWVEFADPANIPAFVERMDAAGYSLPTELPDETFKPVPWMASNQAGA